MDSSHPFPFRRYSLKIDPRKTQTYKYLTKYSLPVLADLKIYSISSQDYLMSSFLENWINKSHRNFSFKLISKGNESIRDKFFENGITKAVHNSVNCVSIGNLKLVDSEIERIIRAWHQSTALIFHNWTLITNSEMDLSGIKYNIDHLGFEDWGLPKNGNWGRNPDRFERLISSISKSGLKDSLTSINTTGCWLTEEFVDSILEKYGIEPLEFIE